MKTLFCFIFAAAAAMAFAQTKTDKKIVGLEKRVKKIEYRVTVLEKGKAAAPATAPAAAEYMPPANPIAVYFIKKKQFVTKDNMGVTLYFEFENVSRRRYNAFNGVLVFKDSAGAVIWSKPYGYSDPLAPGEKAQVALPVSSVQAKEYLRFLKARAISVTLENQEFYGGE